MLSNTGENDSSYVSSGAVVIACNNTNSNKGQDEIDSSNGDAQPKWEIKTKKDFTSAVSKDACGPKINMVGLSSKLSSC